MAKAPDARWLEAAWPFVEANLPPPPARVADLGCGRLGGFVPMLRSSGYDAVGVDPDAPDAPEYLRSTFEDAQLPGPLDAVIASTSLHHVGDPAQVIERIGEALAPGGTLVVLEWAWETFDAETAEWCFERLTDAEDGWLRRRHDEWLASERDWESYFHDWAAHHGLHRSDALVPLLDERLERRSLSYGPYYFTELPDATQADEQAAIDAAAIRPGRVAWVGHMPIA